MRKISHYKSFDRGPLELKSRLHREEGDLIKLVKKPVITIPPTSGIKSAAELMVKRNVRRLPVANPGTQKLMGMLRTRDIINFLGGGDKHKIVQIKFRKNFFAAVNEPVNSIMSHDLSHGTTEMSIQDIARSLLETGVGGLPILDDKGKVVGVISERDFTQYIPNETGVPVSYHMARHVITAGPELPILGAARRMISFNFRRLPVVRGRELIGIITSMDILRYFGSGKVFRAMRSEQMDEAMNVGVQEIMTKEVLEVAPETDAGVAAKLIQERDCGGLPVVSGSELIGIITEHDLLRLLI